MPKTISLRLNDETYKKFRQAAASDNRTVSNLIETLALRKLDEEIMADNIEMKEILSDSGLLKRLKKGHSDARAKRGRMVG